MNLDELNISDLINAVRAVAAERPDRQLADDCCYFDPSGAPKCLVGCALARLGYTADDEVRPREALGRHYNEDTIEHILGRLGIHVTGTSVSWLMIVQSEQDTSERWARAVETADAEYPGLQ